MKLKKLLAMALCAASISALSVTANAAVLETRNGVEYVTRVNNYTTDSHENVTLKDSLGQDLIFSQNEKDEWVSAPVKVTSTDQYIDRTFFDLKFNTNVDIYDYSTGQKLDRVELHQDIYLVSKENPLSLEMTFTLLPDYF